VNDLLQFDPAAAPPPEPLAVRLYPDPVLRRKSAPVTAFDAALGELARRMAATMLADEGAGLAANQVGQAIRLLVILERPEAPAPEEEAPAAPAAPAEPAEPAAEATPPPPPPSPPSPPRVRVLVNPELVAAEGRQEDEERCLSFPPRELRARVRRAAAVRVRYQDLDGSSGELAAEGFLARVLQHELDHLEGILFVDRASAVKRFTLRKHLKEMEADFRRASAPR
jgi:peptide deformylase